MSTSLSTSVSTSEHTALQQAAIARITFFQNELKKRGLVVRYAVEQEFAVKAQNKKTGKFEYVAPFDPEKTFHHLSKKQQSVCGFVTENSVFNNYSLIYEVKFDNMRPRYHATPLEIAQAVFDFRKNFSKAWQEQLFSTTCLYPAIQNRYEGFQLVFDSVLPHPNYQRVLRAEEATMGMHLNFSVYDENGKNIFNNENVRTKYAIKTLELQKKAGLGFLQTESSFLRIGRNLEVPKKIGVCGDGLGVCGDGLKKSGYTVLKRDETSKRLENRLSGADVDPYVVTALQMAAIYDTAISEDETKTPKAFAEKKLAKNRGYWVKKYESNNGDLRNLLGNELYEQIKSAYSVERSM